MVAGGLQNREDVQFLREEGALKTGVCHLEAWLYEASAEPGKVLREREKEAFLNGSALAHPLCTVPV